MQSIPGLLEQTFWAEIFRIQGYDIYKTSWMSIFGWVLASFMVLLASWKIATNAIRWYRRPCSSAVRLFRRLIHQHRLTRDESKIIFGLAKQLPADVPHAALFVDPSLWKISGEGIPGAGSLEPLFEKLFGCPIQRVHSESR